MNRDLNAASLLQNLVSACCRVVQRGLKEVLHLLVMVSQGLLALLQGVAIFLTQLKLVLQSLLIGFLIQPHA